MKQHYLSCMIQPIYQKQHYVRTISPISNSPYYKQHYICCAIRPYIRNSIISLIRYRPILETALFLLYHSALYQKQHHLSNTIPPHVGIISPVPNALSLLYQTALYQKHRYLSCTLQPYCTPETALQYLS